MNGMLIVLKTRPLKRNRLSSLEVVQKVNENPIQVVNGTLNQTQKGERLGIVGQIPDPPLVKRKERPRQDLIQNLALPKG